MCTYTINLLVIASAMLLTGCVFYGKAVIMLARTQINKFTNLPTNVFHLLNCLKCFCVARKVFLSVNRQIHITK